MIEFSAATKRYGSFMAVDAVSLTVGQGEYFALLGPNGAGKTTLIKMLLDFTQPTSGTISVNGFSSTKAACRTAIGYLAENHRMPPHLSGLQYLKRCAELCGLGQREAIEQCDRVIDLIGMQEKGHAKVQTYSRGMIQRFGLGGALVGSPGLLILDEPTAGLDPIGIRETRLLLESFKQRGMTVLLSSHLLSEVEKICDTAAIINRGKLLLKDSISSIIKDGETLEDVFVRLVKG